jgi:anti-sigma factor RsiW
MSSSPITCRETLDFLAAFLAGELAPDLRARFAWHLERCPACRAYLETYQTTIALAREAYRDDDEVSEPLPGELVAAIFASRPRVDPPDETGPSVAEDHREEP